MPWQRRCRSSLISLVIQIIAVIYRKVLLPRRGEDREKCLRYGIICSNAGFLGAGGRRNLRRRRL